MDHVLERSPSLTTPAVRTVVIVSWAHDKEGEYVAGHMVCPVLAVMAMEVRRYEACAEPGELPTSSRVSFYPVICDPDSGELGRPDDLYFGTLGLVLWTVACPWPPEEDESRLAEIIAQTEAEAVEKAKERRAQRPRPVAV